MDIGCLVSHAMLGLMKNARLISKCSRSLNIKNENALTLHQYQRMGGERREYYQMQEKKKTQMFKLQPKLAWRQLKGEKEDEISDFTDKEIAHICRSLICIIG